MPVLDTTITNWQADFNGADTNTPPNLGTTIQKLLDDEARNCKAVIRAECENKMWERWGLTPTYISAVSFSLVGDQRPIAQPNRRVKALLASGSIYGRILSSTFASNLTTVTVEWDLDSALDTTFTVNADNRILVANNAFYTVGDVIEFGKASNDPNRRTRLVSFSSGGSVQFSTADPWINDLIALAPNRVFVKSPGMSNTLKEIQFGLTTPVNFQSGMAGDLVTGVFNVVFNGSASTFTIALPVTMHNAGYQVQIQPVKIVTGTPSSADWTKPAHSASTTTGFSIAFASVLAAGATTQYDYVIQRTQF